MRHDGGHGGPAAGHGQLGHADGGVDPGRLRAAHHLDTDDLPDESDPAHAVPVLSGVLVHHLCGAHGLLCGYQEQEV